MNIQSKVFDVTGWVTMAPGVQRRIIADGEKVMVVEIHVEAGASIKMHQHPHEQISHLKVGHGVYMVDGVDVALEEGESVVVPSNTPHSFVGVERCEILDVFSPPREDFRA